MRTSFWKKVLRLVYLDSFQHRLIEGIDFSYPRVSYIYSHQLKPVSRIISGYGDCTNIVYEGNELFYSPLKWLCQYAWQRSLSRRRAFLLYSFFHENDPIQQDMKTRLGRFGRKDPNFGCFGSIELFKKELKLQKWEQPIWMHSQELRKQNFKNSLALHERMDEAIQDDLKCWIYAAQRHTQALIIFLNRNQEGESNLLFLLNDGLL